MPLAVKSWDGPPHTHRAIFYLKLVGCGEGKTAKPETLFNEDVVPPIHKQSFAEDSDAPKCLAPAGRRDKWSTISQLDRLKGLPLDWNGYGAQPIDVELIKQAKWLVEKLPDDIIETPAVVPMTRGRLQFEWHRGNRSLELEFESRGRIHYLKADDDSGFEEEKILLADQLPEIEELLRWFSSE